MNYHISVKKTIAVITLSIIILVIANILVKQLVIKHFTKQFTSTSQSKILLIWGDGIGEQEQTHRFKIAGQRLGLDLKVVSAKPNNWLYRWYIPNLPQTAVTIMQPDLALTIERHISPIKGTPNYLVLDEDKSSYMFGQKNTQPQVYSNLLKFSGLLPTFPEIDELIKAFKIHNKPFFGFAWYPTIYKTNYHAQQPKKLFYPGGILRDKTRSSDKYKRIFQILDQTGYLAVYGPKIKWSHLRNSLHPPIPFDGKTLLDVQNEAGISLVLHDEQHLNGNVPSGRIFEASAANTVIISDAHPFVMKHFGNNVLYIDVNQDADSVAQQIDHHVKWIFANPEIAREMANNCYEIFMQKFTLEQQLIKLIELNHEVKSAIINPPAPTVELLQPVTKLPSVEVFAPPYEYTYNASLIKNPAATEEYLLAFSKDNSSGSRDFHTKLQLMQLDKDFKAMQHRQIDQEKFYTFYKNHWSSLSTAQDPRFITANQQIYLIYNDSVSSGNREIYTAKVVSKDNTLDISEIKRLNYINGVRKDEKNWSPFVYNDEIYFIYSTTPYVILHWNQKNNIITKVNEKTNSLDKEWTYGEIRGGTPAIFVKELNAYLTFFHSSMKYRALEPRVTKAHQPQSRIYYMGAYIFAAQPPFNLIAYTPTPLSYPGQYASEDLDYHIIFPCGLIEEKDSFLVSAGVQDSKAELFRINKAELYKQFKYINRS